MMMKMTRRLRKKGKKGERRVAREVTRRDKREKREATGEQREKGYGTRGKLSEIQGEEVRRRKRMKAVKEELDARGRAEECWDGRSVVRIGTFL